MKTAQCQCGNKIFFENTQCQSCHSELGFLPDMGSMSSLHKVGEDRWQSTLSSNLSTNPGTEKALYRKCQNYAQSSACNWMVPETDDNPFCLSCRLSEIIPDLTKPENLNRWRHVEGAKRRLIYSLYWLQLPLIDKITDPVNGLSFHLAEDNEHYSEFATNPSESSPVTTGHINGTITINIAEADPVFREEIRTRMLEYYRTLLGHLRHESGHYYWDLLVSYSDNLEEFRRLFGDEREDYKTALQHHYNFGPVDNWQSKWVSAYASAHPWEDWAECWAHYLHMIDTMETAYDFGSDIYTSDFVIQGQQFSKQYLLSVNIDQLMDEWTRLSVMINEINRSLGLDDAYPFYMSDVLKEKMAFVHKVIMG